MQRKKKQNTLSQPEPELSWCRSDLLNEKKLNVKTPEGGTSSMQITEL